MKRMKLLIGIVLISLVGSVIYSCASPAETEVSSEPIRVEITCDEFQNNNHHSDSKEISTGDTLVIVLCSNQTTGFQWAENADISDESVLAQENHEFVGPESESPPPGAPGQEIWTFKALKQGSSTIYFEYSRPWEGGEKGAWTFTLDVTVK